MLKGAVRSTADALASSRLGAALLDQLLESAMLRVRRVSHRDVELCFSVPNRLAEYRVRTFSTKEPETLAWIDSIPRGTVLWDIGANIGLYSCYAAKARSCRVIAFEPSVFNLELLARNIHLNGLTEQITILPLPLSGRSADSTLNMTTTQWGGALSSFGVQYGFDGAPMRKVFEFRTIGLSVDQLVATLPVARPDYIKMDVDGIEHLILRGGSEVFRQVRGVQLEINDAFAAQASESRQLLEATGLRFVSKYHSELIEASGVFGRTFNQVWAR